MKAFTTIADIKKYSIVSGNIDADKLVPWISVAMETHVQSALGTDLYEKIQDGLENNNLASEYQLILDKFIQPMTTHYTLYEFTPMAGYSIHNGGTSKHTSENAETADLQEVDRISQKHLDVAEHYKSRFIDYMCNKSSIYPEYRDNNDAGDIRADHTDYTSGWLI